MNEDRRRRITHEVEQAVRSILAGKHDEIRSLLAEISNKYQVDLDVKITEVFDIIEVFDTIEVFDIIKDLEIIENLEIIEDLEMDPIDALKHLSRIAQNAAETEHVAGPFCADCIASKDCEIYRAWKAGQS